MITGLTGSTISGTFDPNYQTLAGVGGDVFGADKKGAGGGGGGGGKPVAPANQVSRCSDQM